VTGGALVTGAGQGLGKEIAIRLAARGHAVHVTDADAARAEETAEQLGGGAWASALDVRDFAACREAAAQTVSRAGSLRVWVNNAGVLETGPVWQHDMDVWHRVVDTNLLGTMHGLTAALEPMRETGRGHVVNIVSLAALVAVPGEAVYAATKHGVLGLSHSTLADLRSEGQRHINISCVCPGGMWTPMLHDRLDEPEAAMSFSGALLQPSEVADLVERVLDRPSPVRSTPRWRAGVARASATSPRLALRALPLMQAMGRRQQRRLLGRGGRGIQ
jgi:NAD(P)-dependent dehydrogenase (short-subunit alcohol dehydrogenase family)